MQYHYLVNDIVKLQTAMFKSCYQNSLQPPPPHNFAVNFIPINIRKGQI